MVTTIQMRVELLINFKHMKTLSIFLACVHRYLVDVHGQTTFCKLDVISIVVFYRQLAFTTTWLIEFTYSEFASLNERVWYYEHVLSNVSFKSINLNQGRRTNSLFPEFLNSEVYETKQYNNVTIMFYHVLFIHILI